MSPSNRKQSRKAKSAIAPTNTPSPTSPVTITVIPFDFDFFIQNADMIVIHNFLAAVSPIPASDGRNLKLLWKRAYEEGQSHGLDEGLSKCSEEYARGHKVGCEMAATYFDVGREQGMEDGEEHGQEVEHQTWLLSGHDAGQCTPTSKPRSFMSTALQTDDPIITPTQSHIAVSTQTSIIFHIDTSVQASELLSSPSQSQKMSPFDWAEDANLLPITPPPVPRQPCDLSVLRSSSSSPFSSLQHCSKRFTHYSCQPRRHHFHTNSFYSPCCNLFKPSQPHFHTKMYSHLNWESNPRLSDLSRSLKALGWIR